ncbi:hypothetical protein [Bordetella genomosp. 4]|uniref:Uncharacterized protein n=1 Tax=Bordetella genomosp. 4 TaxID=463044 RepID=A0A261UD22_9BORD|nr:hypothetical protein [Bordetella genomosp. 4]OZI52676.1 hypothetical protein CAL21_03360 [Bordetella genomosp. 4]OZI59130.1 hypothetical protein CAL20_05735 [Bordetella genomosp. 4]
MNLPFNVLPGSDAANAVQAVRDLDGLTLANFEEQIGPILKQYHVDPVTASALNETARQVTTNNPNIELKPLTESLVGTAIADPRVAGNNARQAVRAGGDLSLSDREKLAVEAAGIEAEKAGGSKTLAESKAKEALKQGASPEMAAESAATAAVASAVASNPEFASGLEVFGYFKAMVQGIVIETNLSNERHEVKNKTDWIIGAAFIQNTAVDLTVDCHYYHAHAQRDVSRRTYALNTYLAGYYMTSPDPWTFTGMSVGASVATGSVYKDIISPGVIKVTKAKKDFYYAGMTVEGVDKTMSSAHRMADKGLIKIKLKSTLTFLGGNPKFSSIPPMLGSLSSKLKSKISRSGNSGP